MNRKFDALGWISNYMTPEKHRFVMKTFIESQFNYYLVIWMFYSRTIYNKINRLYERSLRIVYSNFKSSFEGLLKKDNSFSIHETNNQKLAIKILNFWMDCSLVFWITLSIEISQTVTIFEIIKDFVPEILRYGTETISYYIT